MYIGESTGKLQVKFIYSAIKETTGIMLLLRKMHACFPYY